MDASQGLRRGAKAGRALLLLVSALVTLNGLGWLFYGPTLATFEQDTGIRLAEFLEAYPAAARLISIQARNTAILLIGLGMMGAARILSHQEDTTRWNRVSGWVFGATLAGIGLAELFAGAAFGLAYLGLGVLALIGQALYRR